MVMSKDNYKVDIDEQRKVASEIFSKGFKSSERQLYDDNIQLKQQIKNLQQQLELSEARVVELENRLNSIGSGEHYFYPKGDLKVAPFDLHTDYVLDFSWDFQTTKKDTDQ
jgi:hypothetical protein